MFSVYLHISRYRFAFAQYFMKRSRSHGISQSRLGQQSCTVMRVFHIRDWNSCIVNAIINHRVDGHCDAVLCQYLQITKSINILILMFGDFWRHLQSRCRLLNRNCYFEIRRLIFWSEWMSNSDKGNAKYTYIYSLSIRYFRHSLMCLKCLPLAVVHRTFAFAGQHARNYPRMVEWKRFLGAICAINNSLITRRLTAYKRRYVRWKRSIIKECTKCQLNYLAILILFYSRIITIRERNFCYKTTFQVLNELWHHMKINYVNTDLYISWNNNKINRTGTLSTAR